MSTISFNRASYQKPHVSLAHSRKKSGLSPQDSLKVQDAIKHLRKSLQRDNSFEASFDVSEAMAILRRVKP